MELIHLAALLASLEEPYIELFVEIQGLLIFREGVNGLLVHSRIAEVILVGSLGTSEEFSCQ